MRARSAIAVCLNPLASPPPADRILVVRLGAVGDVARTVPAASLVRAAWPGAHLAWLVEPAAASLLAAQPWIDEVVVFPRPALAQALRDLAPASLSRGLSGFLTRLRARRFDLVIDFHGILRSALLALATGSRRRVGYARPFGRELSSALATHRARIAPMRVSRFERNQALVRFLGVEGAPAPHPLHVDPAAVAAMRERLGPGPAPIVLHPGTSVGAARKSFPAEVFASAARVLFAELGIPSVVTRGPSSADRPLAEAVVRAAPGAARLAPPTPRPADLAALLACARLAIGPDTGPLHLAALVGTPVVQLLGPTDAVENAPWPVTPSRTLRGATTVAIVGAARELLASAPGGSSAGAAP